MAKTGRPPIVPAPTQLDESDPMPTLDKTWDSTLAFSAWLVRQVILGRVDPRRADSAKNQIASYQTAIRGLHSQTEMDELRDLVKRQEAALNELKRRETMNRSASTGEAKPTSGRTKLPQSPDVS